MTVEEIIKAIRYKQAEYAVNKASLVKEQAASDALKADLTNKSAMSASQLNISYACKLLLEKLVHTSKANLENFLTFALNQIFPNRAYSIELVLKKESKQSGLELVLVENGIKQNIKDAVGGGILHTLGLLLQIYYIEVYGISKVMFIDEGLKAISSSNIFENESISYLENVLNFLKYLSRERGYIFVLVTHDNKVREYADKTYLVERGKIKLWE